MCVVFVFVLIVSALTATTNATVIGDDVLSDTCRLTVNNESRAMFMETILRRQYNFMYMRLVFEDMNDTVKSEKYVILPTHWIWTYKGKDGGHEYLFLPQDFGYLSFGLLWSKCNSSDYTIKIKQVGNCSGLVIGENSSDQLIGEALGNMTSDIAARKDYYNSSYWCYNKRMLINPMGLYRACSNSICTLQSIEYMCCKYVISFVTRERRVECSKEHYHFSHLWWALPIVCGEISFAFYPLILSKLGRKFQQLTRDRSRRQRRVSDQDGTIDNGLDYIRLKQNPPVTFLSTVFSPVFIVCKCKASICLRMWRVLIIILPMALPAVRIYLDWKYSKHLIQDALRSGATIGFSSLIASPQFAWRFLYLLGGPFTAISMYLVFGSMFLVFPGDLEQLLVNGLFNPRKYHHFILTIPLKSREKLGRVSVRNYTGYKKFHNYLLLQLYMILNWKFWRLVLRIFVKRWSVNINQSVQMLFSWDVIVASVRVLIFPLYITFCVVETVLSLTFYALPVVSCFFLLLNAYITSLVSHFGDPPRLLLILSKLFLVGTFVAFFITWYMYCIIYFDGFWFLSRIIMFTFTGIVQFPKLSYGYIILAFMAFYYLMESIQHFGSSYRDLLKLSIEACERVQLKGSYEFAQVLLHKSAIPRQLFNTIVEKHQPKRVKVCSTILKVALVVSILCVSIELLIRFDRFQDLSLVSHVFTVLFICALPKILKNLCIRSVRHANKKKLRQQIYLTVIDYCKRQGEDDSGSDLEEFGFSSVAGYETFDIESD